MDFEIDGRGSLINKNKNKNCFTFLPEFGQLSISLFWQFLGSRGISPFYDSLNLFNVTSSILFDHMLCINIFSMVRVVLLLFNATLKETDQIHTKSSGATLSEIKTKFVDDHVRIIFQNFSWSNP